MYICICMGLTDKELRSKIHEGFDTVKTLSEETSAGLGCGHCRDELRRIVAEEDELRYTDRVFPIFSINAF